VPLSAVDVIGPALQHVKDQLLKPFRLGQWTRLALVGLLAGELSGGGCNGMQVPYSPDRSSSGFVFMQGILSNRLLLAVAITSAILLGVVIWLIVMYLNSRMRFVLFDSILAKECHIRRFWRQRPEESFRFFVWQILFSFAMFTGFALLIGIPVALAFGLGWLTAPSQHVFPLILGGVFFLFLIFVWVILSLLIVVLTKDFVVPQMALENITAGEGWRRLWSMMQEDKGSYAVYVAMKMVLSMVVAVLVGIVAFMVFLVVLIPVGGVGAIAILGGNAAGLDWNVFTIAIAVTVGIVVLAALFYLVALISVPSTVFFSAYSLYFFGSRYPRLQVLLYPPPPAPVAPV
jgi:hypothetical protein